MSKHRLHVKRIMTVGFVGRGDNPPAEVVFFKRADAANADDDSARQVEKSEPSGEGFRGQATPATDLSGAEYGGAAPGDTVSIPEAQSNPQEQVMDKKFPTLMAVLKALGFSKEDVAGLDATKLAEGLDGGVPAPEPAEPTEKGADVALLEKAVAAAQERAEKAEAMAKRLEDERENERFIKTAQQFQHLAGVNPDDFGPLLRKVRGALDAEEFGKLEEVLKGADEAARQAKLFEEVGTGTHAEGSVEAEVQKLAEEIRKADPKLSESMARAEVWKSRPDLMNRYEDERAARARLRGATEE